MFYIDGSTYEGQWLDDKRHGTGMLRLGLIEISFFY